MSNRNIRWTIRRTPTGWEGEATLALEPGHGAPAAAVTARASAPTRASAASRTLAALDAVVRSPLVSAMLPPGAAPALAAARSVARAVSRWLGRRRRARVSGMARPLRRAEVRAALARRGVPLPLVRLGEALCDDR